MKKLGTKEQVKKGNWTAKQGIAFLVDKGDKWAAQSKTFRWLINRMAKEKA